MADRRRGTAHNTSAGMADSETDHTYYILRGGIPTPTKFKIFNISHQFHTRAPTHQWGCLATEALVNGSPSNADVCAAAGVEAALLRAKGLITNERNKTYPDRALAALAAAAAVATAAAAAVGVDASGGTTLPAASTWVLEVGAVCMATWVDGDGDEYPGTVRAVVSVGSAPLPITLLPPHTGITHPACAPVLPLCRLPALRPRRPIAPPTRRPDFLRTRRPARAPCGSMTKSYRMTWSSGR